MDETAFGGGDAHPAAGPEIRCPDCGALVPDIAEFRTSHTYGGAIPGCYAAFAELIGRQMTDARMGYAHMLTTDAYMAQHPGSPGRQASQSVWVHLAGLYVILEHGIDVIASARVKAAMAAPDADFPWLERPESLGRLTVLDALAARTPEEMTAVVQAWARSVWDAWSPHHLAIRTRTAPFLGVPGTGRPPSGTG